MRIILVKHCIGDVIFKIRILYLRWMLRKLGTVLHVSRDGKIVVRLEVLPRLGVRVYDYSMRRLGILYDVIGPVRSPYGLVKPDPAITHDVARLLGIHVYTRDQEVHGRGGQQ
jgi:RNA-binding protein